MTGVDLLHTALLGHDAFVARAVRYLAGEVGVRQFLDLGSGIAGGPMLHDIARQVIPTARVLYVTRHSDVLTRLDERQDRSGSVVGVRADRTDTATVLDHAANVLDLAEPVVVVLTGVLHLVDDATADRVLAALVDAVAAESHVIISHLARDIRPREMDSLRRQLNDTTRNIWTLRNRDHVRSLFAGLDVIDPGVVGVDEWRPTIAPQPMTPGTTSPVWVGVGRMTAEANNV